MSNRSSRWGEGDKTLYCLGTVFILHFEGFETVKQEFTYIYSSNLGNTVILC